MDKISLKILRSLCSGRGVFVNLTWLSKTLKKHRSTIKRRVDELFKYKIIDRPICPFGLFKAYPLLVVVHSHFPEPDDVESWLKKDKNIFAVFNIRKGDYNYMLFEFQESILKYHLWREGLVKRGKIPPRNVRQASKRMFFSNQLIRKFAPNAPVGLIEKEFLDKVSVNINDYVLDRLSFDILKLLLFGEGLKINENWLSRLLGVHRKTISARIERLVEQGWILSPVCRFPNFFVPPNYLFVFSLVEIKSDEKRVLSDFEKDSHISLVYQVSEGKYNYLLFSCYNDIEEYLRWDLDYRRRFPGIFGAAEVNYLSPKMTISIDQQKVSLGFIEKKLRSI